MLLSLLVSMLSMGDDVINVVFVACGGVILTVTVVAVDCYCYRRYCHCCCCLLLLLLLVAVAAAGGVAPVVTVMNVAAAAVINVAAAAVNEVFGCCRCCCWRCLSKSQLVLVEVLCFVGRFASRQRSWALLQSDGLDTLT